MPINYENKLNARRFESFNNDPRVCSLNKSISNVDFKRQKSRDLKETILPERPY